MCFMFAPASEWKEDVEWIAHHTHSDMRLRAAQLVCDCSAVYKSGTGTGGRGHRDACVGTWDLGTRDEGLEDIKYGTRGRQKQGRRGRGMWKIIAKVGGKCDISHFPREYVLVKATHPALLRVPPRLFTTKTPCIEETETVALVFLLMEYWSPTQGRVGCGRQNLCRITAFDSK